MQRTRRVRLEERRDRQVGRLHAAERVDLTHQDVEDAAVQAGLVEADHVARLLADHSGVETRLTLRAGEATRAFSGDEAWAVVLRLVKAGAMDALQALPAERGSDDATSLRIEVEGAGVQWRRYARLEQGTPGASAVRVEVASGSRSRKE